MSLGIGKNGGIMDVLITRNTPIPTKQTNIYTAQTNNQESMFFELYECKQAMTKVNKFLGSLELKEIPPAPRGILQIEVTFDIDANGILNVTAVEKLTGKKDKITINNYKRRISKTEVEFMVEEAENYRSEDERQKKTSAKNAPETYCYEMVCSVQNVKLKGRISEDDKYYMLSKCNDVLFWLDANQLAEKEEFESQQKQLDSVCNSIMKKWH
jgi:L1 cell adhesion molecule like protein